MDDKKYRKRPLYEGLFEPPFPIDFSKEFNKAMIRVMETTKCDPIGEDECDKERSSMIRTRARGWIPFKKRDDYPKIVDCMVELPRIGDYVLVMSETGNVSKVNFMIMNGIAQVCSICGPNGEGYWFEVKNEHFPFIAWLPIPDISDVLFPAEVLEVERWWEKKEQNE